MGHEQDRESRAEIDVRKRWRGTADHNQKERAREEQQKEIERNSLREERVDALHLKEIHTRVVLGEHLLCLFVVCPRLAPVDLNKIGASRRREEITRGIF